MNKTYNITYLPIAAEDLKNIFEYILADNKSAAAKILDEFDSAISHLSSFPFMGTVPRDTNLARMNYRFLVVETFLVFYVVIDKTSTIEIRRILSSKQKYDEFL